MEINNSLQTRSEKKEVGFASYLTQEAVKNHINKVIGGENGTRFITSIVSAVNQNEDLQKCTAKSIVTGALLGESLKLSPSPQLGQFYLVPYEDKKRGITVAQFQLGYKGYIQLAIRSGQYKKINVVAIKQGELEYFDQLNEEIKVKLISDEEIREKTETIGYYAMLELKNGFKKAIYWTRNKMEKHALKYSKGYRKKTGFTFWEKDFDGMAYKTMLRQLISKWGIMSIDLITAFEADMAEIHDDGTKEYIDNNEVVEVKENTEISKKQDAQSLLFGN
jgi:recombination protein RecT